MTLSNRAVALILSIFVFIGVQTAPSALIAQTETQSQALDRLFSQLQEAGEDDWQDVEKMIWAEWSRSGSKSMDYLLERGRAEMKEGNYAVAINHFSALIDHAPDFAEGWNARATAFFAADRFGLSIADIRQTLLLEPRHFGALAGLGMIYERLDQPEAALRAYEEVAKVHPNRPDAKEAIERLKVKLEGEAL